MMTSGAKTTMPEQKHIPSIGDCVQPDLWNYSEQLTESDGFSDSSFPGCQFRLPCKDYQLAVNIKVTGKPHYNHIPGHYKSRCKIEFVGDGKESTFSAGWIYHG